MRSNKEIYNAAIYLRISRDDEEKMESDSIQNQREMLKAYIAKDPEIRLAEEFVDDGYTGTNFDRPGFQAMMDQVQANKIDCIIVKDLSRLGRNYIETGRFIDQIFPMLKVRFISINDNYDSFSDHNEADEILVPFKNLINDAYCRDISMKIRSQIEVKRKNGKFVGAWAPYGYKKDPEDKYHLVIDDKAADIVRMIFNMKLEGYSQYRIAKRLNEMGVLTPLQYKRAAGLNCNVGYWKSDNPHWVAPAINRILTNELYIGNLVQGKRRKVNYKVNKYRPVDKEDWIRVEGTHEPLVTKAVFDTVQELMQMDTRTSPSNETVTLFSGIIKCAYCGQNMHMVTRREYGKKYKYYVCSTAKNGEGCVYYYINAEKVENAVTKLIEKHIALLLDLEELLRSDKKIPVESRNVRVLKDQIETADAEIDRYKSMQEKLQEDLKNKIIDLDDYEDLEEKFTDSIEKSSRSKESLMKQLEKAKDESVIPFDWIKEVCSGYPKKLDRKTAVMLIDKIRVFSRDRIEVSFRYGDEMKALAEYIGKDSRFMRRRIRI